MANSYFEYNGEKSWDYGLLVSGVSICGAPNRKVEKASVPGRNGDIIIELGGFDNYQVAYEVSITDNFFTKAAEVKNWLLTSSGYGTLRDSYDTTHSRLAACYQSIEYIMAQFYRYGRATIIFDCKPQRFLDSGRTVTNATGSTGTLTLTNPTKCWSRPFISVNKAGTLTVWNDYNNKTSTITITTLDGASSIYIDSESMQCFDLPGNNKNSCVEMLSFPELGPGENKISYSFGSSGTLSVIPRWWEL